MFVTHLKKDGEMGTKDEMPGLKPRKLPVVVETVDEDEEQKEEYRSPMEDEPLGERSEVREHDDDDVPYKENVSDKPYPDRKEGDKLDFSQDFLRTENKTVPVQLPPEELKDTELSLCLQQKTGHESGPRSWNV